MFNSIKNYYIHFMLVAAVVTFIASLTFLYYSQNQTQYLINFDAWRFFEKLRTESPIESYLFHNVHTFVVQNLLFYIDVLWSKGNLKLFHVIIFSITILLVVLIWYIAYTHNKNKITAAVIALLGANIWLGMSNSVTFSYPVVDVLSTFTLFSMAVIALTADSVLRKEQNNKNYVIGLMILIIASFVGFFSLEVFLSVIFLFIAEAWFRKKYSTALISGTLLIALIGFYLYFQADYLFSGKTHKDIHLIFVVHNFLFYLGGQFYILFSSLGLSNGIAKYFTIFVSVVELLYVGYVTVELLKKKYALTALCRLSFYMVIFSIFCVVLAVLLRYGSNLVSHPIGRYTCYSTMFSLGILLLGYAHLSKYTNLTANKSAYYSFFMIILLGAVSFLDNAMFNNSYPSKNFYIKRLEMPVYALSPGAERKLGPESRTKGKEERYRLHGFMKKHGLSIFSDPGFSFVGNDFLFEKATLVGGCEVYKSKEIQRDGSNLLSIHIRNKYKDGYYFLLDDKGIIRSYSIPTNLKFGKNSYMALFFIDDNVFTINNLSRIIYSNKSLSVYSECIVQ